jgi:hypothetical protein
MCVALLNCVAPREGEGSNPIPLRDQLAAGIQHNWQQTDGRDYAAEGVLAVSMHAGDG